jgi:hypothetical protein
MRLKDDTPLVNLLNDYGYFTVINEHDSFNTYEYSCKDYDDIELVVTDNRSWFNLKDGLWTIEDIENGIRKCDVMMTENGKYETKALKKILEFIKENNL